MSRFSWVLLILLAILAISQLWTMGNKDAPSWTRCKESLLIQTITGSCTLSEGLKSDSVEIDSNS